MIAATVSANGVFWIADSDVIAPVIPI